MNVRKLRRQSKISIAKMNLYMEVPRIMISLWETEKLTMTDEQYNKYIETIKNNTNIYIG